jgi:hypothetical protein
VSELAALQRDFGAAIASRDKAAETAPIFRGPPETALARLSVYRGNVVGACTKALAGAYPIVAKIVGESFFEGLAREYMRRFPSTSGDLNEFGAQLGRFVARFEHTRDLPYLPDVARMEWLAHRAYYARDAVAPDPVRLASALEREDGALRLGFAPACALLASPWPLTRIWEVHQEDYQGEFSVDLEAGPERILIYRPQFRVLVGTLSTGSYRFLERCRAGATVGAALDAALVAEPGFDLGAGLAVWLGAGVIDEATEKENA